MDLRLLKAERGQLKNIDKAMWLNIEAEDPTQWQEVGAKGYSCRVTSEQEIVHESNQRSHIDSERKRWAHKKAWIDFKQEIIGVRSVDLKSWVNEKEYSWAKETCLGQSCWDIWAIIF